MIAELHDRITAAEASIRTLRALRPWIIAGTIASIIGTILKILPIHPQGNELLTPPSPATNTNSLHIGTTATPDAESRAAWLTTEDVARREKKSPRTILTWITEGRITPAPIQTDRAWLISPDYIVTTPQPLSAATSR